MPIISRGRVVALALLLTVVGRLVAAPQQSGRRAVPAMPGDVVHGSVHRQGDERYQLTFGASGAVFVEVTGAPADCAFQVGSQGFQESDSSPVDWTDGQPGQAVRHAFRVQAGRPGTVWVLLRSRTASVAANQWSGVACSNSGPYYTTADREGPTAAAPGMFEGRPVYPPITFRLVAQAEVVPPPLTPSGASRQWPANSGRPATPADERPRSLDRPASLRDDRLGFSLDHPQEWSAVSSQPGTIRLTGHAGTLASEAVVAVTVVAKSASPNSSGFQQLLRIHERLTDAGADLVKLGQTTLGGQDAAFASHVYEERNAKGKTSSFDHVQLVLDHGANYYLISFVAPHDVFVQQTAVFKQIVTTWRFLP